LVVNAGTNRVGIGTDVPGTPLEVNGQIAADGGYSDENSGGTQQKMLFVDSTNAYGLGTNSVILVPNSVGGTMDLGLAVTGSDVAVRLYDTAAGGDVEIQSGHDLVVKDELEGSRQCFMFAREISATLSSESRYLNSGGVGTASGVIGPVCIRNGSIVGFSIHYEIEGTPTGDLRAEVHKNGVSVWSKNLTSTIGYHDDWDTQARGTDTFSAGDRLFMVITEYDGGNVFVDAVVGVIEFVYDT
jgi:hypothetical protein